MARYTGALLLAVLVLWTGEARGECAWVLWTKYDELLPKEGASPPGWELQGAYPAREECLRVKERMWQAHANRYRDPALKDRVEVKEVPYEAVIVNYLGQGVLSTTSLFCLPDTVNPKR